MYEPQDIERRESAEQVDYAKLVGAFRAFADEELIPSERSPYEDRYRLSKVLLELPADVPQVPGARLRVDMLKIAPQFRQNDFIEFHFDHPKKPRERVPRDFADLGLALPNEHDDAFHLEIRIVDEEYRNQGVGTKLFAHVEGFMQELANQEGRPMDITVWGSQMSALQWAVKNGFKPDPEWKDVVEKILRDPEGARTMDYKDPLDRTWKRDTILPPDAAGKTKEELYEQRMKSVLRKTYTPQLNGPMEERGDEPAE